MKLRLPVAAAALALLLTACGDDAAEELPEGEREAASEVLEGSISDEMLPLDRVRSQAPRAEEEESEADGEGDGGGDAE